MTDKPSEPSGAAAPSTSEQTLRPLNAHETRGLHQFMGCESTSEAEVQRVAEALARVKVRDDEGEFPPLFDMLNFSGENKCWTVVRALARVALAVIPTSVRTTTCDPIVMQENATLRAKVASSDARVSELEGERDRWQQSLQRAHDQRDSAERELRVTKQSLTADGINLREWTQANNRAEDWKRQALKAQAERDELKAQVAALTKEREDADRNWSVALEACSKEANDRVAALTKELELMVSVKDSLMQEKMDLHHRATKAEAMLGHALAALREAMIKAIDARRHAKNIGHVCDLRNALMAIEHMTAAALAQQDATIVAKSEQTAITIRDELLAETRVTAEELKRMSRVSPEKMLEKYGQSEQKGEPIITTEASCGSVVLNAQGKQTDHEDKDPTR